MRTRLLIGGAVLVLVLAVPASAHYIGLIYYPPAIGADGSLYVSGTDGYLYALRADGTPRWVHNASVELTTPAVISGGRVAVGTIDGRAIAVEAGNGTLRWEQRLSGAPTTSIVAGDGTLYAVAGSTVYALDPATGTERWRFTPNGSVFATPAVARDRTRVYVAAERGRTGTLYALGPDGDVYWRRTYDDAIAGLAAGADGRAYFETDGTLHALSANGTRQWRIDVGDAWSTDVARGRIVVGTLDGRITVVRDGTVVWRYDAGDIAAPAFGPDGERIYAVVRRGVVAIEGGERLWRTRTGATVLGPPAVGPGGERVYVGTQVNRTYAIAANGSIAWIDRYATPFGSFFGLPPEAEPPAVLANATRPSTRLVYANGSASPVRADATRRLPIQGPGFGIVAGIAAITLVALARRYW